MNQLFQAMTGAAIVRLARAAGGAALDGIAAPAFLLTRDRMGRVLEAAAAALAASGARPSPIREQTTCVITGWRGSPRRERVQTLIMKFNLVLPAWQPGCAPSKNAPDNPGGEDAVWLEKI